MTWDKPIKIINIVFSVFGMGLMLYYETCDTSCSSLQGTFAGVDLKMIGILFMAVLLALALPPASRRLVPVGHLRAMMLSGALGGEAVLVRFQIVNETYCPFCLAYGMCILILFAAHFFRMNKILALACFCAGIAAFALFFKGSVLPLYL